MANRVFSYLGAGFTGSFLYNNIETVTDFVQNFGTSFVRALAVSQKSGGGGDGGVSGLISGGERPLVQGAADPAVRALAAQVQILTAQLGALNSRGGGVTVFTSDGRQGILTAILVPTALGATTLYVYSTITGTSMSSFMYVSRHTFKKGMSAVTAGMGQISSAVVRVRKELNERIDALSSKVDGGVDIAKQTQKELGAMHEELAQVGVDVSEMQRLTHDVEEKLDKVMAAQGVTNRGVRLLCSVFDEATGQQQQQQQQQQRQKQGREVPALNDNGRYLAAVGEAVDGFSIEMLPASSSSAAAAAAAAATSETSPLSSSKSSAVAAETAAAKEKTAAPERGGVSGNLRSEIGRYLREDLDGDGGAAAAGTDGGWTRGKKGCDDFDLDSLEANIQDITNMYGR